MSGSHAAQGSVSVLISAVDGATKTIEHVKASISNMMSPVTELSRSLERMGEAMGFERIHERISKVTEATRGLAEGFTRSAERLGMLLMVEGGLGFMVKETAEAGANIGLAAEKIGITTEQMSELKYVGHQVGLTFEQLTRGLGLFGKNVGEAARGNKELQRVFRDVGVSITDTRGHLKPTAELLLEVAEHFSHMADGEMKAALATKVFGKSGRDLIPMLNLGSKAIGDMMRAADRLGITISTRTSALLHEFSQRINTVYDQFDSLRIQMLGALSPALTKLTEHLANFLALNHKGINDTFERWGASLMETVDELLDPMSELRKNLDGIGDTLKEVGGWFSWVAAAVGGPFKASLLAVGLWVAAPVVTAFGSLAVALVAVVPALASVTAGVAAMLALTPVGWAIDASVAIGALGYEIVSHWDRVRDAFADNIHIAPVLEKLEQQFTGAMDRIHAAFEHGWTEGVVQSFKEFNPVTLVKLAMEDLKVFIGTYDFGAAVLKIKLEMPALPEGLSTGLMNILKPFKLDFSELSDSFSNLFKDLGGWQPILVGIAAYFGKTFVPILIAGIESIQLAITRGPLGALLSLYTAFLAAKTAMQGLESFSDYVHDAIHGPGTAEQMRALNRLGEKKLQLFLQGKKLEPYGPPASPTLQLNVPPTPGLTPTAPKSAEPSRGSWIPSWLPGLRAIMGIRPAAAAELPAPYMPVFNLPPMPTVNMPALPSVASMPALNLPDMRPPFAPGGPLSWAGPRMPEMPAMPPIDLGTRYFERLMANLEGSGKNMPAITLHIAALAAFPENLRPRPPEESVSRETGIDRAGVSAPSVAGPGPVSRDVRIEIAPGAVVVHVHNDDDGAKMKRAISEALSDFARRAQQEARADVYD